MERKTNCHPHDGFFRSVFYKPERCADLLRLAAMQNKKYAFEPDGLKDLREDAHRIFFEIPQKERTTLIRKTMLYLTAVKRPEDKEEFMDFVTHRDVYGEPSLYEVLEKEYVDAHKAEWKSEGIKEGVEEGIEKGVKKGVAKGLREGKLQIAKAMLADGMPLEKVAKYSGFSVKEIQQLA